MPFGLVRFGVAPDHPEVKLVENKFGELARDPRVGFIGNVQVNKDLCTDCCMTWLTCIALTELQQHYDAVISCSGAQGDRTLGIKGESLDRVYSASTATLTIWRLLSASQGNLLRGIMACRALREQILISTHQGGQLSWVRCIFRRKPYCTSKSAAISVLTGGLFRCW